MIRDDYLQKNNIWVYTPLYSLPYLKWMTYGLIQKNLEFKILKTNLIYYPTGVSSKAKTLVA